MWPSRLAPHPDEPLELLPLVTESVALGWGPAGSVELWGVSPSPHTVVTLITTSRPAPALSRGSWGRSWLRMCRMV